jgi:sensor histidine kinase YesM
MNQKMRTTGITFVLVTLIGAAVGVFLTLLRVGPLWENIVVSVCIGLVSVSTSKTIARFLPVTGKWRVLVYLAGVPFGALAGIALLALWLAPGIEIRRIFLTVISVTLVLGGGTATAFFLYDRKIELEHELHAAALRRLDAERRSLEAQLKMLQAQIEPHFLFNTLANVTALIGTDPTLARQLLERLIVYLRATLSRTRAANATLADEVQLLRAYLEIFRIRMGERLQYRFDVAPELAAKPFPPMLLQPLVENAIKHGLESRLGAGELNVTASNSAGRLRIAVCDNGVGFTDAGGSGTGLTNVRERLAALYGDAASLELEENSGGGVTARLALPV